MISCRWRQVLRDLWAHKSRTVLVILSIAVGVFAVGTVAHMRAIIARDLVNTYQAINPAHVILYTASGFDQELVQTIQRMPEVQEVEGRRSLMVKFKLLPEDDWHTMQLFAIPDYESIRVGRVAPEEYYHPDPHAWPQPGVWPPPERALLLERTALLMADLGLGRRAQQGQSLVLEMPDGKRQTVRMAGLCYDFSRVPATFAGRVYGYITLDTLEWLGLPRELNELHVRVAGAPNDWDHIKQTAAALKNRLERSGHPVSRTVVPEPGKLPLDAQFQAMSLILGALGGLVLFLAAFLVTNTVSALLTVQIRQIGAMKAVGAQTRQLVEMYLGMVALLGLLALAVAAPLGAYTAHMAVNLMAYFINFSLGQASLPWSVLVLEGLVGILTPVLAALYPVLSGARITVREAMASHGAGNGPLGTGRLDRLVESIRGLPRPLLLSLRNTFRRKSRLALTLATLTLAGAIFMAVLSVRSSLNATLEDLFQYWQFDVEVQFAAPYRLNRIETNALQVPGVTHVESWGSGVAYRVRADGSESADILVTGPPAGTQLLQPRLLAGRWLRPDDENAVVINTFLREQEPDLQIGRDVVLKLKGRQTTWKIVGVIKTLDVSPLAYANYDYLATVTRQVAVARRLQVVTHAHDSATQVRVARALVERFQREGMQVSLTLSTNQQRTQLSLYYNLIVTLLLIMAALLAVVGGLGLMGTMSLNVLERTREIGVMRAVGASDGAIQQIFITEGILIGVLSWVLGAVLALPLSKLLSDAVGTRFLGTPLTLSFSLSGIAIWLVTVVALAALATYGPAQRAAGVSVCQVLAYE